MNRPVSLARCVSCVLEQSVLPVEIVVVDDGCLDSRVTDDLRGRCEAIGVRWHYRTKNVPGLPRSRNVAVELAVGDIVQFLDDDVTLEPGFLESVRAMYAADKQQIVAGADARLLHPEPPGWRQKLYQFSYRLAGWWAIHPRRVKRLSAGRIASVRGLYPVWNVVGATLSARRSVLKHVPFDEALGGYALGEDRDWAYRAGRRRWVLRNERAAAVHHNDPGGRPDPHQFGRMTVRNYLYILRKTCDPGIGQWVVIGWTFIVLLGFHLLYCVFGNRSRHLAEIGGMLQALSERASWRNNWASSW
jgi:glycosyltransferase involved in cell wall biosynthesis